MEDNDKNLNLQQPTVTATDRVEERHTLDRQLLQFAQTQDENFLKFAEILTNKFDMLTNKLWQQNPLETIVNEEGISVQSPSETIVADEGDIQNITKSKQAEKRPAKGPLTTNCCPYKKPKFYSSSTITKPPTDTEESHVNHDDDISLHGDDNIDLEVVLNKTTNSDNENNESENDEDDMSELWKEINSEIDSREKTGPSVDANLATIVNELWHNPLEKDKFVKKLEAYPKPENCKNLIVRRCNEEIWRHKSLQAQTRQKDLKNQRNQNTLLKGAVAIAKVADNLINLKKDSHLSNRGF